ncbi:NlpC/P60 family protein [Lactobacillus sp. ESL0731]|uniref:NlpC/P60 family protein n=1 Tax=unclassified Lactobacillus TaxID=2620435 RepID=UPI0023F64FC9|nr:MULTISPECIES: NlpC/P60 family protein [unclassified Lactobacillus]WEV50670.1 NlpC/P60 family protein [Lactobacillus sp. ESL0700]WEV61800.1 NlpC/P60 family protein [Lactobacillus sp. ESL0731]
MSIKAKHFLTALLISAACIYSANVKVMAATQEPASTNTPSQTSQDNNQQPAPADPSTVNSEPVIYQQQGSGIIFQTHYGFSKKLNQKGKAAKGYYNKRINYSKVAQTAKGTFVKTKHGWLNKKAFNQYLITKSKLNYKMKVIANASLYNKPAHTNGARKISSINELGLKNKWVHVNMIAHTNINSTYYRFSFNQQNYWIQGAKLKFNLNALKGSNRQLERAITKGEKMIGHSVYNENTRHYDCSSFVNYLYSSIGHHLGSTTFSQCNNGRSISYKHKKRGDLIFFDDQSDGHLAHVGIYLGKGLFLHDSPYTITGGVDVSSLHDAFWNSRSAKSKIVHYPDGIVRRII